MMDRLFGVENYLSDIENPMLRSGLLFSKPNEKAPSLEQDGIMTANEISAMDFSGVDLVVLSACQSGLGDVMGSEGVFGLQRAFKMAGVEKLIVSLWKVPDEATAELMAKFYEHYLAGDDVNKALRKAQMAVREKYVAPFYWAGFCVVN
jgi:CHAT domain-containing protein